MAAVREAEHAGSWYSADGRQLANSLDAWLAQVPDDLGSGQDKLPVPGARAIIAPHAGYAYSGPAAAWAYKALDLGGGNGSGSGSGSGSGLKRIFILHPSHHHGLSTAALPTVTGYRTPLSRDPLPLDLNTIQHLASQSQGGVRFTHMSRAVDEAEHSAEMQLPFLHRLLQRLYPGRTPAAAYPPLVPIMVGATSAATEAALGRLLAPYVADAASNAFVISSDFCHWGSRFQYTYYVADAPSPALDPRVLPNNNDSSSSNNNNNNNNNYNSNTNTNNDNDKNGQDNRNGDRDVNDSSSNSNNNKNSSSSSSSSHQHVDELLHKHLSPGTHLRKTPGPGNPHIYESIAHVDRACMCAIATGEHAQFVDVLRATGNTVCGRHPIGVFMAAVEEVKRNRTATAATAAAEPNKDGRFHFIRYERSSDCTSVRDSSVSYVSAYALL